MGTPEFAVPTLKALVDGAYHVLAVVTQPDRPRGRGKLMAPSPVKAFALEHGMEVLQPQNASDPTFCKVIDGMAPDLIIVVAFGQILRKNLLSIPPWGVINIHGSLLPRYRGAAPIQRTILNNERRTGLSVMRMDEGMDTGPILFQKEVEILKDETFGELHDRLAVLSGDVTVRSLRRMMEAPIEEIPQDHSLATYAPKIQKEMCVVNWDRPAGEVSAHIRGLDPRPGAGTRWQGEEIKLFASRVLDEGRTDVVPGRVVTHSSSGLAVETGRGMIDIREVQAPGKRRMPAAEFLRGFPLPVGSVLGNLGAGGLGG